MLAVLGMVIYSWAIESDKHTNMKASPVRLSRVEQLEEDTSLLKTKSNGIEGRDVELGQAKSWVFLICVRYLFLFLFVYLFRLSPFF